MRLVFPFLFILISASASAQIPFDYQRDFKSLLELTKDKTSDLYYGKLRQRFIENDSTLNRREVLALMIGFINDPHYRPLEDMETEAEIYMLNEEGDYETALEKSKQYLATHPVSLRILKERSYSYHQTGKRDSAGYFMDQVEKIMSAMVYSGRGKDPETPIFSLGLNDGEFFIPNAGMSITHKATGRNKSKNFMEIIRAMTEEGVYVNYYFVIQHAKDKMDGQEIAANSKKIKKDKKGTKTNKTTAPEQGEIAEPNDGN